MTTKIEWTDETWNVVTGCSKLSSGCANCYAEKVSHRFKWTDKPWNAAYADENVVRHPDRLMQPLHWKKPRKVFVNSMSDLFHEQIPDEFLDEIFGVILACKILENHPDHVFQILTKRPERMLKYFTSAAPAELLKRWSESMDGVVILDDPDVLFSEAVSSEVCHDWDAKGSNSGGSEYKPWGYTSRLFPLSNVWIGVSVENQQAADERIPFLLQTPAFVRFLSCEPLLGPIRLDGYFREEGKGMYSTWIDYLDWVIAGGESGSKARPMHPSWARDLRGQCEIHNVPFFFKQHGEWLHESQGANPLPVMKVDGVRAKEWLDGQSVRVGKKVAGRSLDGRTWDEFPNW